MENSITRSLQQFCIAVLFFAFVSMPGHADPVTVHAVANPSGLHPLAMQVGGRMAIIPAPEAAGFGAKNYTSQWPGSYFRAAFRGNRVFFRVVKGDEILHVMVDGQQRGVLVKPAAGVYQVDGLNNGKHRIGVFVATESQAGPNSFGGFALPSGEKALQLPRRNRQIEFIGDSFTVGYGNLSSTRVCSSAKIWADTNNLLAFGPGTALHYGADYQINAISGRGVVRNYNGAQEDTVPEAYPYVLFDKKQKYNDPSWKPQVIVIGLGTNDFSTKLNPGERWKTRPELHTDYEATYAKFLKMLRARNAHAYMIVWATDVANGEITAEAQKVVSKLQQEGFKDITYLSILGMQFTACDSHPSLTDDKHISDKLVQVIDAHKGLWKMR